MTGDVAAVRLLVRLGVTICIDDSWVVYEACLHGCDMLRALSLNPGIDLNPAIPGQMGDTVLHFVLRSPPFRFGDNKDDVVAMLLLQGANAWARDRIGNNALHIITNSPQLNDDDGYKLLQLFYGETTHVLPVHVRSRFAAEIDAVNKDGNTALMLAVLHNHVKCVQILLSHGANPRINGEFGKPPLFFALSRNFSSVVHMLQYHGASLQW
jgi:hypothetical protein